MSLWVKQRLSDWPVHVRSFCLISFVLAYSPVIVISLVDREMLCPQGTLNLHELAPSVGRNFALMPGRPHSVDQSHVLVPGEDRLARADLRPVFGSDLQGGGGKDHTAKLIEVRH